MCLKRSVKKPPIFAVVLPRCYPADTHELTSVCIRLKPAIGLEPMTCALRVHRIPVQTVPQSLPSLKSPIRTEDLCRYCLDQRPEWTAVSYDRAYPVLTTGAYREKRVNPPTFATLAKEERRRVPWRLIFIDLDPSTNRVQHVA